MTIGEMTYTEMTDELAHHGIKGQKWGVRRFQNADGSLTANGKKRYLKNTTSKPKAKSSAKKSPSSESKETVEQKKDRILRSKSVKDLYDNSALYDNKELQDAVVRKRNEKSLQEMLPKKESKIDKFLDKVSTKGKKIADAAGETARAIENVKKLIDVFGGKKVEDTKTSEKKKENGTKPSEDTTGESNSGSTSAPTSGKKGKKDKKKKRTNDDNSATSTSNETVTRLLESGTKIAGLLETSRSITSVLGGGSDSPKSGGGSDSSKTSGLLTSGSKNVNRSYSKADKERMRTKTWIDLGNGIFDTGDVLNTKSSTAITSSSYNSGKQIVSGYLTSGVASLPASTASTAVELWKKRD